MASGDRDLEEDRECGPKGTSPVYLLVQGPSEARVHSPNGIVGKNGFVSHSMLRLIWD